MKLTREEIEAGAWEMIRQGRAPGERTLQEWIRQEVHKLFNPLSYNQGGIVSTCPHRRPNG